MKTYAGVDPGKTGCVALILELGNVVFFDAENGIDLRDLGECIGRDGFVLLEKVQVMPGSVQRRFAAGVAAGEPNEQIEVGQGRVGILNYGIGYGEYLGMLKALRIPFGEIYSRTWKKEFSLLGIRPLAVAKQRSINVAKDLFPSAADRLTLKKHHGRAEALLIAEYARRRNM
jgi:hypothetical protein